MVCLFLNPKNQGASASWKIYRLKKPTKTVKQLGPDQTGQDFNKTVKRPTVNQCQ